MRSSLMAILYASVASALAWALVVAANLEELVICCLLPRTRALLICRLLLRLQTLFLISELLSEFVNITADSLSLSVAI